VFLHYFVECQQPSSLKRREEDEVGSLAQTRNLHHVKRNEVSPVIPLGGRLGESFLKQFDWETKRLFIKWLLTGGGRLREVVAMKEC